MPAKPVGPFPSQKAARAYLQSVINDPANRSQILTNPTLDTVMTLFHRHPDAGNKLRNLASVRVQPCPEYPSHNQFRLIRTDGSEDDISIDQCVTARPRTHRQEVNDALRQAVKEQVDQFGDPKSDQHRHHTERSFATLRENWMTKNNLRYEDLSVLWDDYTADRFRLADPLLEISWQEYHREHAALVWTTAAENLRTGRQD